VGREYSQNGGASYTKERAAKNNPLQETDKNTQETMGRWRERENASSYLAHTLGKPKPRHKILETTHS
jgi:hypothetical protein